MKFCLATCLLSIIVGFSCTFILQGSAATKSTCSGTCSNHFSANCLQNSSVKNFESRLKFREDIDNKTMGRFLGHSIELKSLLRQRMEKCVFTSDEFYEHALAAA